MVGVVKYSRSTGMPLHWHQNVGGRYPDEVLRRHHPQHNPLRICNLRSREGHIYA